MYHLCCLQIVCTSLYMWCFGHIAYISKINYTVLCFFVKLGICKIHIELRNWSPIFLYKTNYFNWVMDIHEYYYMLPLRLKTFSVFFLFSIDFFYIYIIYCRKFSAEFNKLIKTVGYTLLVFFEKWCWTFATFFLHYLDIFIFSLIKPLNCNKTLNMLGL